MDSYHLVLVNIILLTSAVFIAQWLANVYPGKILVSSGNTNDVAETEVQRRYRSFIKSLYVLILSLIIDTLDVVAEVLLELLDSTVPLTQLLSLEARYVEAWMLFWSAAVVLFCIEWRSQRRYLLKAQLFPISPLISALLRWIFLIAFALWVAHFVLDWPSEHILVSTAALAAVGVVVMKSTLGDLLSGLSLHISRAVLPSHWIDIKGAGISGEVIATNWRETRIRTAQGHMHVVPNSVLASQPFHNMSWPDSLRRHKLTVYIAPEHDFETVRTILLGATQGIAAILTTPKPPSVIIRAMLEFGIQYEVRFWSNTFHNRSSLESEVYANILSGLQDQRIELAYTPAALLRRQTGA